MIKDIDVLFYGGVESHKGSDAMVEVCNLLISKNPDITICIIGYDESWVNHKLFSNNKNVILCCKVSFEEAIRFYQRSRVYASTSYYEGLNGICLEAMAMELPVVVWDLLFYRNLVIDHETGVLVPVDDNQQMAMQIKKLLSDDSQRIKMGNQSRSLINKSYNWENLSKQVLELFN